MGTSKTSNFSDIYRRKQSFYNELRPNSSRYFIFSDIQTPDGVKQIIPINPNRLSRSAVLFLRTVYRFTEPLLMTHTGGDTSAIRLCWEVVCNRAELHLTANRQYHVQPQRIIPQSVGNDISITGGLLLLGVRGRSDFTPEFAFSGRGRCTQRPTLVRNQPMSHWVVCGIFWPQGRTREILE